MTFDNSERSLKKVLNLFHLLFLGVSCVLGAGAYSVIGLAAQKAGPSIMITFIIVGLLCFFTCFPYAEFAAKIQSAGFAYSYVYSSCGELLGYLTGHALHLTTLAGAAIAARCVGSYIPGFLELFGIHIPRVLYDWDFMGFHICLLGGFFVFVLSGLMLFGMKESTAINNIVSILNLLTISFAIIAGLFYVDTNREDFKFFENGYQGVFAGMGLAFYAYAGFECLTCFTEEAIHPERDIPLSLIIVLIVAIIMNGGVATIMTLMAPLSVMNNNQSLLAVFSFKCPPWMGTVISVGSISGLLASLSAGLMSQPRIFYSMAFDRLLPKLFMTMNPKTQVPDVAVVISCIIAAFITLFLEVDLIGNVVSLAALLISALVDLAVIVARYDLECSHSRKINRMCSLFFVVSLLGGFSIYYSWHWSISALCFGCLVYFYIHIQSQKQINIPINFACPFVPLIPMLGALMFLFIASTIEPRAWMICLVYLFIGLISYFMYGYWQSKLNPYRTASIASIKQNEPPQEWLLERNEIKKLSDSYAPDMKRIRFESENVNKSTGGPY